MKKLSNFSGGFLVAVASLFCFSIVTIVGSFVYKGGATPQTLLTGRFIVATALFFLTLLKMGKDKFVVERKDRIILGLNSGMLAVHLLLFWHGFKVLKHVPTTYALFYTYPFWVVILSALFLKEQFSRNRIRCLLLGTLGALFVISFLPTFSLDGVNLVGIGMMLLAAIAWAGYAITGQLLLKKYHQFTILFYNFGLSLLVFLVLQKPAITLEQLTTPVVLYLVLIGVVSSYFAYLFYYTAIEKIKASNMALANLSLPFLSTILAVLILHQEVSGFQLLGMCLIVFGGYLLYREYRA